MKQTRLKAKEVNREFGLDLSKKDQCILKEDVYKILYINNEPCFFYSDGKAVPTLKYLQNYERLKKITVDMGAIKFVINGADVMRPGITKVGDGITKDDFIVVVDETHGKPLAVGIALLGTDEMRVQKKGKCVKSIHYVGDAIWNV